LGGVPKALLKVPCLVKLQINVLKK